MQQDFPLDGTLLEGSVLESAQIDGVAPNGNTTAIVIDRVEAYAVSAHPAVGPVSSLGPMPVRNGVLIAITCSEGITGWGEIWCNFPPRGNVTRLNLLQDVITPHLLGARFDSFDAARPHLEKELVRMAIHTGEFGPFAHCLAGIDTALADLAAKRAGLPLAEFLSPGAKTQVETYASTPNTDDLDASIGAIMSAGHKAVKLKIGNGQDVDTGLIHKVAKASDGRLDMCLDANQRWTCGQAIGAMQSLAEYSITFIEEPLSAYAPLEDWARLAAAIDVPLAGGENITSLQAFTDFMDQGKMQIAQPDVAKWGGVSGALEVGRQAGKRGAMCAMHYMGTALGLAASAHVLAAVGGNGPVELDANPNPLRTDLGKIDLTVIDGTLTLPKGPGHGFLPNPSALRSFCVAKFDAS